MCGGAATPVINEFVANHVGTDTNEHIEIKGSPSTDFSAYSVIQVEGDESGTATCVIDSVHPVGTTNSTGHWSTGFLANALARLRRWRPSMRSVTATSPR